MLRGIKWRYMVFSDTLYLLKAVAEPGCQGILIILFYRKTAAFFGTISRKGAYNGIAAGIDILPGDM